MITALETSHLSVTPGRSARVDIQVTNTADVIDGITALVDGINPDWVRLERPLLSVFPDASDSVGVVFDIPRTCPAGDYLVVVRVVSTLDATRESVQDFWLTVEEIVDLQLALTPSIVSGGAKARFAATVANTSNTEVEVTVNAWEPTRAIDCRVEPQSIVLPYGESARVDIDLRGPRPWFGQPLPHAIVVTAQIDDTVVEQSASFNQKPRIPRGLITAVILACIVLLWALIFLWVISEIRDGDVVTKAVATDFVGGADNIPLADIAGLAEGRITAATTGEGVERITVEANRVTADGELLPVGSVASGEDGRYALTALVPGTYLLRFSADGYDDLWYPGVPTPDEAMQIPIVPTSVATPDELAASSGLDIEISGDVGRLRGAVAPPADSADVVLTVTATPVPEGAVAAPADAGAGVDGAGAPIVGDGSAPAADGPIGPDGTPLPVYEQVTTDLTFDLQGLPTPATYDVRISGDGFETQEVRQTLGGGDAVYMNTVRLGAADGSISGIVVNQSDSRLGDVTVTARAGEKTFTATTPTAGLIGEFQFVGLDTPETYVLTFEREGFGGNSLALSLAPGENRTGLRAVLVGGNGTVTGTAVDGNGLAVGGAAVTVAGGETEAETATLTTGSAGSFVVSDLDVPQRYTVTVSAEGFQTETVSATLLASGTTNVGNITLLPVTSDIRGTVTLDGTGVGDVTVTLGNGQTSRSTVSATNPAGQFAFSGVTEGTYTLTVDRDDVDRKVVLVRVVGGVDVVRDVAVTRAAVPA
jgi:Carboxypeptidase regulatory-like domain